MARLFVGLTLAAVIVVAASTGAREKLFGDGTKGALGAPLGMSVPDAPVPLQGLLNDLNGRYRNAVGSVLRGSAPQADAPVARPFANRGSRRAIGAVRHGVRRALRTASTRDDRLRIVAWHGVFVAKGRALALVDVRRSVRSSAQAPFRLLPTRRVALGMRKSNGRWHAVGGLPTTAA